MCLLLIVLLNSYFYFVPNYQVGDHIIVGQTTLADHRICTMSVRIVFEGMLVCFLYLNGQ